jgi:hypothetical protein
MEARFTAKIASEGRLSHWLLYYVLNENQACKRSAIQVYIQTPPAMRRLVLKRESTT